MSTHKHNNGQGEPDVNILHNYFSNKKHAGEKQLRLRVTVGINVIINELVSWLTCVQAALVAVGPAQTEAAVAGVTRLREGRSGVDGVSTTTQHICGIQELGVGHSLWTQVYIQYGHVCVRSAYNIHF